MKHPSLLHIEDFNYDLPNEKIAKYPLKQRDQSKLLIYGGTEIRESIYANIAEELPQGSLLVFNDTKVVEARLLFQKPTGGLIELFCLEPADHYADITTAMLQKGSVQWKCLVGGAKKWKEGALHFTTEALSIDGSNPPQKPLKIIANKVEILSDCFIIEFSWEPAALSFAEVLHLAGDIPLPPYLNRETEEADKERYQTIYAKHDGSVAAPTAGLHFTQHVFSQLEKKQIYKGYVTLHVGAGTFKPVKAAQMKDHEMHAEFIDVNRSTIEQLLAHVSSGIIAVGTTSLRTLESLYWIGVKTIHNPSLAAADLQVSQWEPYGDADRYDGKNNKEGKNTSKVFSAEESLRALLEWMKKNNADRIITKTQIIIAPGYTFRIISALVTNFHQPQSTLLLLISAIVGEEWRRIYEYALTHDYRFLSYGDGSLLWINNHKTNLA
ncbi:S-adenosylmethionine:tRNA ribosyltransferase-isomerase [Sediminibacterium sp. TEGAF015]|uniref:S-adenosylmethionine:tRNA ribosyltransferase-isomerase n=1 Tax=Sediminibacterium sp. TEGAF015 TaxID=575378 RepID=UPI0021FAE653|nr:S-adenosylmethionine:tRNA ribosyltransferase-isomerase [Sediminibacterium sp. TEGAF015]BDQ13411.1 S-adenosylmethionine:tRNA ribosyltransferase-isomerase [Sediminibacterium sp. TEGAF015]